MQNDCLNRLVIPESHKKLLEKSGVANPYDGDQRRYVRRYAITKAVLHYQSSLPALPRIQENHLVVILDLSRSGVGFFHSEQLFPCERGTLILSKEKQLPIEIAWCQRVAENCYQIGAKFAHGEGAK